MPGVFGPPQANPAGWRGREGGPVATRHACQGACEATGAAALALAMAAPRHGPGRRSGRELDAGRRRRRSSLTRRCPRFGAVLLVQFLASGPMDGSGLKLP